MKNLVILSTKSSGSSACQNLLSGTGRVHHVDKTRHFENETLYWTKAASVLGMPQIQMLDSEVPIPPRKAKEDLQTLLKENVPGFAFPADDRAMIFQGWKALCERFGPVFLEKSPHHLVQQSALKLLMECTEVFPDIQFLFVGLVRNPMDYLYSAFSRWRISPEKAQYEWLIAYRNLLSLQKELGDRLVVVRYEDMIGDPESMRKVLEFCEVQSDQVDHNYFRRTSLQKWKKDRRFGFVLASEVMELAKSFGYRDDELQNTPKMFWPVYQIACRHLHKIDQTARRFLGPIKRKLTGREEQKNQV